MERLKGRRVGKCRHQIFFSLKLAFWCPSNFFLFERIRPNASACLEHLLNGGADWEIKMVCPFSSNVFECLVDALLLLRAEEGRERASSAEKEVIQALCWRSFVF